MVVGDGYWDLYLGRQSWTLALASEAITVGSVGTRQAGLRLDQTRCWWAGRGPGVLHGS